MIDLASDGGPRETPEQHVANAERYGYSPDPWAVEIVRLQAALRGDGPAQEPSEAASRKLAELLNRAFDGSRSEFGWMSMRDWLREIYAIERGAPALSGDRPREALECAEYALTHPESDQQFALNAVRTALSGDGPDVEEAIRAYRRSPCAPLFDNLVATFRAA